MSSKDDILQEIKTSLLEILPDLDPASIVPDRSMKDLGANSIDRADVIIQTMEAFDLKFPLHELGALKNIGELVDDLHRRLPG
ncbi:MAG: acyl carrier protein [Verrucomicrobiota bacterium]